jgi:hypothetical protein
MAMHRFHVIGYVRARGRARFSERSERRLRRMTGTGIMMGDDAQIAYYVRPY